MRIYTSTPKARVRWKTWASLELVRALENAKWKRRVKILDKMFVNARVYRLPPCGIRIHFYDHGVIILDFPPYMYSDTEIERFFWKTAETGVEEW